SPGTTFQAELTPVRRRHFKVKVPVANAPANDVFNQLEISVEPQGKKGPAFDLGYNGREQKIEGALPDGVYVIKARNQGENLATGEITITVKGGPVEGPPLTLLPGASVQFHAKMELQSDSAVAPSQREPGPGPERPGILARGQNFSAFLEPVDAFATADLLPHSVAQSGDTVTFLGVAPGTYWVRIESPRGFAAAAMLGDVDLLKQPLAVGPGVNLVVDVMVQDNGAEVSGVVDDAEGRSPAESGQSVPAYVYCVPLPESTGQFRQTTAQSDGTFDLQQLAPGEYRLLAFDHPQRELEYHNAEAMKAYEGQGQVVRVGAAQKEKIRLPLIAGSE
ncbi:MAG TPA: hypothetical protein VK466_01640, partial [Terriglobales bacterium]|nr:hypothetical protein [Terriglobales bacterium]